MKNIFRSLIFIAGLFIGLESSAQARLSSFPTADATIYLDFDGHTVIHPFWNAGFPLHCEAAEFDDEQITEIFHRVAEDFRPFDVNITTDSMVFLQAPLNARTRIIITPTSNWYPGVGGVSFIGSFTWGDDTPSFVFSDRLGHNTKYVAECTTHESGHAVGLSHQSAYDQNCQMTEPYATGAGSGEIGWAPVMGNSYYRNMTGWSNGPTPYGCALTQDNLTIITTQNGFDYREDDYNDEMNENTFDLEELAFSHEGVISKNTDKDVFRYTIAQTGMFHFEARPFGLNNSNIGANLDIMVEVYNQHQELINVYNPLDKMNVNIDTLLNAGTYYFVVSGTGNQFGSDYGSLGSYTITGSRGALPIHNVHLMGNGVGDQHQLSWIITADEPIETQELQVSVDGISFETLAFIPPGTNFYEYRPNKPNDLFYRLRVTSIVSENALSNTVVLKSTFNFKPYMVGSIIRSQIRIVGDHTFDYRLMDYMGRVIKQGKGSAGQYEIDAANLPAGMYLLVMGNEFTKQTERIIKQ